jgi:thiosulfate/3-mercaptopyruvate sulfurtransferase
MSHAQLITPEQLAIRLSQPDLLLLDCRFALDDSGYGKRVFAEGHLPGAHFLDLQEDLSGPVVPGATGRHPLPDASALAARLASIGLSHDSHVVIYDDGNSSFAARVWWLLYWLGKREAVALLDGGLQAWKEHGGLLTTDEVHPLQGDFWGQPDDALLVDAARLQQDISHARELTLLDARAEPRFLGEVEPIDPVAGHIPGASCFPFTGNLDGHGRFHSAEQLHTRFEALASDASRTVVAYCGSGVTACHNLFAMSLAGLPMGKLYAGSWSEWITNPNRPVATGPEK